MHRRGVLATTASAPLALRALGQPACRTNLLCVFPGQFRGSAMGFLGREPVLTSAASN